MKCIGTCKDCDNWNGGEYEKGECRSSKWVYDDESSGDATPIDGVSYWDYENYYAGFQTGRDFGCVHWTGRGDK